MTITLLFSRKAFADVDRFADFLRDRDPEASEATLEIILNALDVLRRHPYIGRPVERGLRELLISRGRTGYVALYEFDPARNEIVLHARRHQLEAGYQYD